ncbi:MAG: 4Fe-4S binding protein [Peptococcaceae bacterium]|nr:4Fe-4S binding protein [Peptococcaceae bacterium]
MIPEMCIGCLRCMKLGCPCIIKVDKKVRINATQCVGCNLCASVCPNGAIGKEGNANE